MAGHVKSSALYEAFVIPGNTIRPTSSTGFGTLYAVSVPDAGVATSTELVEAEPQLASPAAHGESVLSRIWTPCNAQEILEELHWLSLSVSFIDDVVSTMISTL